MELFTSENENISLQQTSGISVMAQQTHKDCAMFTLQRQTVYLPFVERAAGGVQKGQIQKLGKFVLETDEASSFLSCYSKQGLRS